MALKDAQAELDALQARIVENKITRDELRAEAKKLRAEYFELEAVRERELKAELEKGAE